MSEFQIPKSDFSLEYNLDISYFGLKMIVNSNFNILKYVLNYENHLKFSYIKLKQPNLMCCCNSYTKIEYLDCLCIEM